jgi:hypothetical protein
VENKQQQNTGRHRRTDITTTTTTVCVCVCVCVCACVCNECSETTRPAPGENARATGDRERAGQGQGRNNPTRVRHTSPPLSLRSCGKRSISLSSQDGRGLSPPKKTTPGQRTSRPHRSHSVDGGAQTNAQNGTTVAEQRSFQKVNSCGRHSTVRHGVVWCGGCRGGRPRGNTNSQTTNGNTEEPTRSRRTKRR